MTQVTCRLTAKNRDQLWNPTLGSRVWAYLYLFCPGDVVAQCQGVGVTTKRLRDRFAVRALLRNDCGQVVYFIYFLFKHRRQRADATYMPVKSVQ